MPHIHLPGCRSRPAERFAKIVDALAPTLRRDVGEGRNIEIEWRKKWDDTAMSGQPLSDWSKANRRQPSTPPGQGGKPGGVLAAGSGRFGGQP
jgi:hypothetical protein